MDSSLVKAGAPFIILTLIAMLQDKLDTLQALREAGVYITFEEFKSRAPIVRQGQVIPVQAEDFDNPYLSHYYQAETGGQAALGHGWASTWITWRLKFHTRY